MKELFVGTIQYLAGQNLAFRGGNEKLFEKSNGNFLKLIESIAKFDNIRLAKKKFSIFCFFFSTKYISLFIGHIGSYDTPL